MITHSEYKNLVNTTDVANVEDFKRVEVAKVDTYLTDLIGSALLAKVEDGTYPELLPYLKKCLAWEILIYYTAVGNVVVTPIGATERSSEFSRRPEFADKKNKLEQLTKVLRGYEKLLLDFIEDEEYTEAPADPHMTQITPFNIFAIGDDE